MKTTMRAITVAIFLTLLLSCQYEKSKAEEVINLVESKFDIGSDGESVFNFTPVDGCILIASPYSSSEVISDCGPVPSKVKDKVSSGNFVISIFKGKDVIEYKIWTSPPFNLNGEFVSSLRTGSLMFKFKSGALVGLSSLPR